MEMVINHYGEVEVKGYFKMFVRDHIPNALGGLLSNKRVKLAEYKKT